MDEVKSSAPSDPSPKSTNWVPSRKAISGGIGGILSGFIVLAAAHFGYPLPQELQASLPAFITWLVYYLTPASDRDIVRNLDNKIVAMAVADPASPVTQNKIAAEVRKADAGPS